MTTDDFSKYIALRNAGEGAVKVLRVALEDGLDTISGIRMIRAVYGLGLVEAKETLVIAQGLAKDLAEHQARLAKAIDDAAGAETPSSTHAEQPLEVLFGAASGDHFRFEVLGQTCPEADSDWYRAQLNTAIRVQVGSFRGYRSLVMFTDNFRRFGDALSELAAGAASSAWLQTGDYLAARVSAAADCLQVSLVLDALQEGEVFVEFDGGNKNWEWSIEMPRAGLEALTESVNRIGRTYPWASVP